MPAPQKFAYGTLRLKLVINVTYYEQLKHSLYLTATYRHTDDLCSDNHRCTIITLYIHIYMCVCVCVCGLPIRDSCHICCTYLKMASILWPKHVAVVYSKYEHTVVVTSVPYRQSTKRTITLLTAARHTSPS